MSPAALMVSALPHTACRVLDIPFSGHARPEASEELIAEWASALYLAARRISDIALLWICPAPSPRGAHCRSHLNPVPVLLAGSWTYPSLGPPTPEPEDSSAADGSPQTPKALAGPPDQDFSITQPGRGGRQSDAAKTSAEAAERRSDASPAGTEQLEAASSSSISAAASSATASGATGSSSEEADAAQPESQPDSAERLVRLTSLERMDEEELEDEDFTDALSANTDPFTRQLLMSEARTRAADRLKRRAARKAAAAAAAAASQEGPQGSAPKGAGEAAQPEEAPADQQELAAAPGSWIDGDQGPCAECAARQAAAGGDGHACACRPQQTAEAAAGSAAAEEQEEAGAGAAGEAAAQSESTAGPVGGSDSTKLSSGAAEDGATAHTSADCGEAEPGSSSQPGLLSGVSAQGGRAAGTAETCAGSQQAGCGRSGPSLVGGSSAVKGGAAASGEAAGPSTPPGSVEPPARRRSRQQPGRSALVSLQRKASKGYCIHRWARSTFSFDRFCCGGGRCAGGRWQGQQPQDRSKGCSLWHRLGLHFVALDDCPPDVRSRNVPGKALVSSQMNPPRDTASTCGLGYFISALLWHGKSDWCSKLWQRDCSHSRARLTCWCLRPLSCNPCVVLHSVTVTLMHALDVK